MTEIGQEEPALAAGPGEEVATITANASRKENPASLQMRAQPVRALRFKREVLIGAAAVASCALAGTAWWALTSNRHVGQVMFAEGVEKTGSPADSLSGLPKSYDAVPQLGPPLPGDLGRPILHRQRERASQLPVGDDAAALAARDAAAARERDVAELRSARQSTLLATTSSRESEATSEGTGKPTSMDQPAQVSVTEGTIDPDRDQNAQARKLRFMAALDKGNTTNPYTLERPISASIVSAGSVIAGSLITGLRSDLPGLVTAQVSERVYDSATGRILLIPQGARLIGEYDSAVAYGQSRALIAWQRIILPDGSSIRLDNAPATDPAGYTGLSDRVDQHSGRLLKGVAIATLLGVGANLTFSGESDLVQAMREATQQNVARAGDQIAQRNLQVQPTITIRPGTPVRLLVQRDLILPTWKE
ncbi:TrbI/VirB10 family protein [Sphingobium chlorophenolicum]|uniref:Conjugal transfer protein TrbI n=1 Tax=Sphingobium chlorophenolicum TaxID=46429 RepID=A0A081RCE6_SPHCR|nr:TrbI/VirB10 family protein [Sphingobium chlorophenolicum]KEQ52869.1 Conjugal transfer protein TrbI [Sphingobium chlorophenolicum]